MTLDATAAQTATAGYAASGGGDASEAHGLALFALVSGQAFPGGGAPVPRRSDGPSGTYGYACFRSEVPVVVMITDEGWRHGPGGSAPHDDLVLGGRAPTYDTVVAELDSDTVVGTPTSVEGVEDPQLYRPTLQVIGDGFTRPGAERENFFLVPPLVPEPGGPD